MIVDQKIELVPKLIKDFPDWSFLPEEDLERLSIQIFSDQKTAKTISSKNQKIIKIKALCKFSFYTVYLSVSKLQLHKK